MYDTLGEMRKQLSSVVPGYEPSIYNNAINRAYNKMGRIHPWIDLEKEFKFVTKAWLGVGGVAFTNGAATITAATTVSAGWSLGESNGFAGMFIKKPDEAAYYTITASSSVEVTITENYPGTTTTSAASAGEGYLIFQHIYTVHSSMSTVYHIMGDTYLMEMDTTLAEARDPDLDSEGEPYEWRSAGMDSSANTLVQLYPPKINDVYELRGRGLLRTENLVGDTVRPLLDSLVITALAELELLRRKKIISPASVTDEMLVASDQNVLALIGIAKREDYKKRNVSNYTQDRFFGGFHRGQDWYVRHDPMDR
jgi:hypothetical protein